MSNDTKQKLTLDKLLKFLCGEEPISGRWFGERYEGEPAFWWRPELKRLINSEVTAVLDEVLELNQIKDPIAYFVSTTRAIQTIRSRYE